ncbi:sensor histidine kinase [Marinobacterium sediminicola]|uniref:histidine kinase n=1 Tax=Marinobacterium sediminicola TaxID=518898 RepID=A0ABY1S1Q4_9GAMM|nr:ATP-binding protein [Marinobacterium sediminicola]ULG69464.1 histidine kinase [Marinobacterium sediminicola]SMR75614.1 Histidine kinase-, DNA gyrase B-, and HSP90-like ATPase [Marinobacterium sediminicola]
MAVSLTRWFARLHSDARPDTRRYRPQRELLHRITLTLIRNPDVGDSLPELLRQGVMASGFSLPIWLAWRRAADANWNLTGTGRTPASLETARLFYQLDLASRGDRYRLSGQDTLDQQPIQGLRLPDGDSGLQLWMLSPVPPQASMDSWSQLLRDLGQAIREGLDIHQAQEQQLLRQRQELQQSLAASLHDSVAQQLCYLCLQTGRLEKQAAQLSSEALSTRLQEIRKQTRQAYRQTRELISSARIRLQHSLEQELQCAITEFEQHSGIMFELDNRLSPLDLPEPVAVELLLILREALSNAVRHAHARHVSVQLLPHNNRGFHIRIQDDGRGLPDQRSPDSFGLGIMEERARKIGACLRISSTPAQGTCIEVIAEEICP